MMLRITHLSKIFTNEQTVISLFKNLSVILEQGKTYALQGASGSGKSTLLHLLAGLDQPTEGVVFVGESLIAALSSRERARMVALVTQTPLLLKEFSVLENVVVALLVHGASKKEALERGLWYLEQVGLWHTKDWAVQQLSGGQRQRIALARALSLNPAFLLADEPTGSLDEKTGSDMISLLLQLQKQEGMGLLIATHDRLIAERMDLVFTIKDGILVPDCQLPNLEAFYERTYAENNDFKKNSTSGG